MKVVKWTPQALEGLEEVIDYILDEFGVSTALKFQEKVSKAEMLIADNPKIFSARYPPGVSTFCKEFWRHQYDGKAEWMVIINLPALYTLYTFLL